MLEICEVQVFGKCKQNDIDLTIQISEFNKANIILLYKPITLTSVANKCWSIKEAIILLTE